MKSLKNKFHLLEKLGTEPILSNVHPMAIRCDLVWMAHNMYHAQIFLFTTLQNLCSVLQSR